MGMVQAERALQATPIEQTNRGSAIVAKVIETLFNTLKVDVWARTWDQVERVPVDSLPGRAELIHRALRQGVRF